MPDVLVVVGHQPWSKGANNDTLGVNEFDFNKPLAPRIAAALMAQGIDAKVEEYQRGGGNVTRWNGASKLLVEMHCNSADQRANGTCVLYGENRPDAIPAASALASALSGALRLPLRHNAQGVIAVGPEVSDGRDANGYGGGYLVRVTRQVSLVAEPFFVTNTDFLRNLNRDTLVSGYVAGITSALQNVSFH